MHKIAVVQFKADTDKQTNLKRILRYIQQASKRGAELCAFPEFMMFFTPSSQSARELADLAETANGEFVTAIAQQAKKSYINVVGTFYEKSPKKSRVYDTSFLIDTQGKLVSKYRKIHLYDALGFKESKKLFAGDRIQRPINTKFGSMGMMICYDLRFPEMSRMLASSGADILIAPSAWVQGTMKEEQWMTINRTRALENGCYLIAPDQVGNIYCGRSLAVDPFGVVLLDMKKRQGIGMVEISQDRIKQVRKGMPLMKNRRLDIYRDLRV